ncbi:hypothetical protein [Enterococcus faecalis]|uniref:hypothetical protein n=1 Tax=Enterococcus faecalis TaxID=1351 RepID=UPI00053546BA|nr:hypothetical protein [Enterococcus faecalis]EGO5055187.1 hypothetical protein [Enterococcus faecalis]EGO7850260.1 hypothetical protein [Enterococcus faecalis]EIB6117469.1 hypothetical protein [Enterococcus faecalis]EKN1380613.1 hypothetical protein [Enterococcus faecalis]
MDRMFANLTLRERRLLKQAQVGATISFILLFVPILTISLLHTSDLLAKWLGIVGIIMVLPLLYFAWQILKIAYKDQKDNPTPPLWVPKVYGIGLSINPYHRFGKLIFILLAVLIVGIIISLLFTPASQINH